MERLYFENVATIVPSLNIQNSGDIQDATACDVRKSHEKIRTPSIKTESDDLLFLETASSPICLDNPKSSGKSNYGVIPGGIPNFQTKEEHFKNNKEKEKVVKKKSPITILQAATIEENTHQCEFCPRSFRQKEHLHHHIGNVHKRRLISANSVQGSLVEENHYVNTSRLPMTGASPLRFAANYVQ